MKFNILSSTLIFVILTISRLGVAQESKETRLTESNLTSQKIQWAPDMHMYGVYNPSTGKLERPRPEVDGDWLRDLLQADLLSISYAA